MKKFFIVFMMIACANIFAKSYCFAGRRTGGGSSILIKFENKTKFEVTLKFYKYAWKDGGNEKTWHTEGPDVVFDTNHVVKPGEKYEEKIDAFVEWRDPKEGVYSDCYVDGFSYSSPVQVVMKDANAEKAFEEKVKELEYLNSIKTDNLLRFLWFKIIRKPVRLGIISDDEDMHKKIEKAKKELLPYGRHSWRQPGLE